MATHSSIPGNPSIAWEIPWTEESGGIQSMGLQKIRHDLATKQYNNHVTETEEYKLHVIRSPVFFYTYVLCAFLGSAVCVVVFNTDIFL